MMVVVVVAVVVLVVEFGSSESNGQQMPKSRSNFCVRLPFLCKPETPSHSNQHPPLDPPLDPL